MAKAREHKVTYLMTLKVKRCKKEFKKGMGAGVLVMQEVTFTCTEDEHNADGMFIPALIRQEDEFTAANIEVTSVQTEVTSVQTEGPPRKNRRVKNRK